VDGRHPNHDKQLHNFPRPGRDSARFIGGCQSHFGRGFLFAVKQVSNEVFESAVAIFVGKSSIREVMRATGIHKVTASNIRKLVVASYLESGQPFQEITGGKPRSKQKCFRAIPVGTEIKVPQYLRRRFES